MNYQRLNTYQRNGIHLIDGTEEDCDEDEEEITYIRRITNICRTTINNYSQRVQSTIDSITPEPIRTVANKCPSLWFLAFLGLFASVLYYNYGNHLKSSPGFANIIPPLYNPGLPIDPSSKEVLDKMAQMAEELSTLRRELSSLKNFNEDYSKLDGNDFNSKEKLNYLSDKIDSMESYFNNYMKNCCRNETDTILALIDDRLSAFMSQMLSDNQNNRQSLTPSDAAEELKKFILLELSKTNDDFRKNVEQKLMLTVKGMESRITRTSEKSPSNITIDEIKTLISQALAIYDADKTGQPDFALEPAGEHIQQNSNHYKNDIYLHFA